MKAIAGHVIACRVRCVYCKKEMAPFNHPFRPGVQMALSEEERQWQRATNCQHCGRLNMKVLMWRPKLSAIGGALQTCAELWRDEPGVAVSENVVVVSAEFLNQLITRTRMPPPDTGCYGVIREGADTDEAELLAALKGVNPPLALECIDADHFRTLMHTVWEQENEDRA